MVQTNYHIEWNFQSGECGLRQDFNARQPLFVDIANRFDLNKQGKQMCTDHEVKRSWTLPAIKVEDPTNQYFSLNEAELLLTTLTSWHYSDSIVSSLAIAANSFTTDRTGSIFDRAGNRVRPSFYSQERIKRRNQQLEHESETSMVFFNSFSKQVSLVTGYDISHVLQIAPPLKT